MGPVPDGRALEHWMHTLFRTAALVAGVFASCSRSFAQTPSDDWGAPGDGATPIAMHWLSFGDPLEVKAPNHLTSVGSKGAVSQSVPFKLPPALFAPPLGIAYNSQGSFDAEMAYGWSIAGVPSIRRPTERAYDADMRTLSSWDLGGTLEGYAFGSGTELFKLHSATSEDVIATYYTSTDVWELRTSTGYECTLEPADAGSGTTPGTALWRATECHDRVGNSVEYVYVGGLLDTIRIGGNVVTLEDPTIEVTFSYTAATNIHSSARTGSLTEYGQAVDEVAISVVSGGVAELVRTYVLDLVERDGVQLVASVSEIGHDGATSLLGDVLSFEYSEYSELRAGSWVGPFDVGSTESDTITVRSPISRDSRSTQTSALMDFNGDGLPDLVAGGDSDTSDTTWTVTYQEVNHLTGEHSFGSTASFTGPGYALRETVSDWMNRKLRTVSQTLDVDGDSLPDVVVSNGSTTWQVWYGDGAGFDGPYSEPAPSGWSYSGVTTAPDTTYLDPTDTLRTLMDMNGDGWADGVMAGLVFLHSGVRGSGWTAGVNWWPNHGPVREVDFTIDEDPVRTSRDRISETMEIAGFHDLNGDGLPDYVNAGTTTWTVYYGNGYGYEPSVSWPAPDSVLSLSHEAYPSVEYEVLCSSCASGTEKKSYAGEPAELLQSLVDVNGDGLVDYVMADAGYWYKNLGDGFDSVAAPLPTWWPTALSSSTTLAESSTSTGTTSTSTSFSTTKDLILDLDHDGMPDRLRPLTVDSGTYPRPHLLIRTETSRGLSTDIAYVPSSNVTPSGNPAEVQRLATLVHLVESLTTDDATADSGEAVTTFGYGYGVAEGGSFKGFENRTIDQDTVGTAWYLTNAWSTQLIEYELDRDFEPLPVRRRIYTDGCRKFSPTLALSSCPAGISKLRVDEVSTYASYGWHRLLDSKEVLESGEGSSASISYELTYEYDGLGRLLQVHHDGGGVASDVIVATYTWASSGPLQRITSEQVSGVDPATGSSRTFSTRRWLYDGLPYGSVGDGYVTGTEEYGGWVGGGAALSSEVLAWQVTRGTRGQMTSVTEMSTGRTESYDHAFGGAVLSRVENAYGDATEMTLDSRGRAVRVDDVANLTATETTYDALDRVIETSREDQAGTAYKTTDTTYYTSAAPWYMRSRKYLGSGSVATEEYFVQDGAGATLSEWRQAPTSGWLVVDYVNRFDGSTIGYTRPQAVSASTTPLTHPGGTLVAAQTRGLTYVDAFGFDREIHQDYAAGLDPALVYYDGPNTIRHVDPAGFEKTITNDVHRRAVAVAQPCANTPAAFAYDPLHRIVKYVDPSAHAYTHSYDGAGRLRRASGPDIGYREYSYTGKIQTGMTDSASGWANWTYDVLSRPLTLEVSDPVAPSGKTVYSWTWDTSWVGEVASTTDPAGGTSHTYDAFGREDHVTRSWASGIGAWNFDNDRDLLDRTTATAMPFGATTTNTWSRGWLQQTSDGGATINYAYNVWGLRSGWTSSTGPSVNITYPTPLWADKFEMSAGGTLHVRTYNYQDNGFPVRAGGVGSDYRYYEYDTCSRLTGVRKGTSPATAPYEEKFGYDQAGNPTTVTEPGKPAWNYAAAGTGGVAGNQVPSRTSGAVTETYTYDAAGRVKTIARPGITTEYKYDGLGRLRAVLQGGTIVQVIDRDVDGEVVRRAAGNPFTGPVNFTYSYRGARFEQATARAVEQLTPELSRENGVRRWLFQGRDNQATVVVSDAGAVVGSEVQGAYGLRIGGTGVPWELASFHGNEFDPTVGLFDIGARHLTRRDGQWLQPEPMLYSGFVQAAVLDPQQLSPYRYSRNNPLGFVDPTGRNPIAALGWVAAETGWTLYSMKSGMDEARAAGVSIRGAVAVVGVAVDAATLVLPGAPGGAGFAASHADDALRVGASYVDDAARLLSGAGDDALRAAAGKADDVAELVDDAADAAKALPDNALVCRGGTCTADRFASGSGVSLDDAGKLQGVSVNSAPGASLEELTKTIPNKQVGVTTVGDVRAAGGDVIPSGRPGNPTHATMSGITPQKAEELFTPTTPNPNR